MGKPKPIMTPEQEAHSAEQLRRLQTPIEQATAEVEGSVYASLAVMRGRGENVFCNQQDWNVSPFILRDREAGYLALRECHAVILAEVFAGKDGSPVPLVLLAGIYNRLIGRRVPTDSDPLKEGEIRPFTVEEVGLILTELPSALTKEDEDRFYEPILMNLRRHHPEITREDLEPDMDIPKVIEFFRAIIRSNNGIVDF